MLVVLYGLMVALGHDKGGPSSWIKMLYKSKLNRFESQVLREKAP